jgi:hypothetical protein
MNRLFFIAALALCVVGTGCFSAKKAATQPLQPLQTQTYLLDIKESPEGTEARLLAISLVGQGTDDYFSGAVAVPAEAAALDAESSNAESGKRTIYRLALRDNELKMEELRQKDLFMVMAEPREEVTADLKLLRRIRMINEQKNMAPVAESTDEKIEMSFLSSDVTQQAMKYADAEAERSNHAEKLDALLGIIHNKEMQLGELKQKHEAKLQEFESIGDDIELTRPVRQQLVDIDLQRDKLQREITELRLDVTETEAAMVRIDNQRWSDDEKAELKQAIEAALEAMK